MIKSDRKKLVDILHQPSDNERTVMYWGAAYGVNYSILNKMDLELTDMKIVIKDIVNELAEMAIVDRVEMEKAIMNTYSFFNMGKLNINFDMKLYSAKSMEDVLFVNEFIGKSVMDLISENMSLFKDAASLITKNSSGLKECISISKE